MKGLARIIAIFTVAILPLSVWSQELPARNVGAAAGVSFASHYVWRGQRLSDNFVLQPSVGINYGRFGANVWTNNDLDSSETTETDVTLNYVLPVGKGAFEIGYINYAFDGFKDTQEFYVAASYDAFLSPALTFYYDFDEGDGAFLQVAIGRSVSLTEEIGLDFGLSASANFDNSIMGQDGSGNTFTGFYNAELSASAAIPLYDLIAIVPSIAYSFSLSDDSKTAIEAISVNGNSSIFYGGLTLSLDF